MEFEEIHEGSARLFKAVDGERSAFYNPRGRFPRDVFVKLFALYGALQGGEVYAEPFSATGVKGIRLALEGGRYSKLMLNDIDELGYRSILMGIEANGLVGRAYAHKMDVNEFFDMVVKNGRADAIDVDPYGSSIPYVFPALRAVKDDGIIAFTFTDTQVLAGVHSDALLKRYHVELQRSQFLKELQARIAISAVITIGSYRDIAAVPIFAHVYEHYIRAYFRAKRSAKTALDLMKAFGEIYECSCGNISEMERHTCDYCGNRMGKIGPLYLGPIFEKDLLKEAVSASKGERALEALFSMATQEMNSPFYYDMAYISSRERTSAPSLAKAVDLIRSMGFNASRTTFAPTGIKTDAPFGAVRSLPFLIKWLKITQ